MRTADATACASYALVALLMLGCRAGPIGQITQPAAEEASPHAASITEMGSGQASCVSESSAVAPSANDADEQLSVTAAAYSQDSAGEAGLPAPGMAEGETLALEPLVADVLSRNPDIRSATAAWRAASQRFPQEVSLDDPMFGVMLGPGSWGSDLVESAYTLEASQKIPWPGKRRLRGNIARAEANAAYFDIEEQRLRIAEATRRAYYDYFLAHRQLAVLNESTGLLGSFREIALRKFESAEAEQQDVLLADVELAQLERQRLSLARAERVARARINTLLLAAPDSPLVPPPDDLAMRDTLPSSAELIDMALAQRPELAAQAARLRRERYTAALAHKEFLPDMEFVARYDAFWQEEPLRPMVGMNVNVPIYTRKRWAALREANARGAQQEAALESQANEISYEIERTYQRVQESAETLKVYQERILPAARHSVEAAQASYTAGRLDFLRLIESQRQSILLQEGFYEAVAEHHARLAELERQVGAEF